jgi:hypothetical protein
MRKKIVVIFFIILGIFCLVMLFYFRYREEILFYEEFKSSLHWDKQCTKADTTGNLIMPSIAKEFRAAKLKSQDGMLHLYTGNVAHTGGGEWSRQVDVKVDKKSKIEWKWAVCDPGDYRFWIRIKFNNNRSLYYKASDSRQPGFYRGGRYIPYKGEKYRDREGRLRFFPMITIFTGISRNGWMICNRSLADDYKQSYGDLSDDLAISEIAVGMMDDSGAKINETGIDYIKISRP